jgi:excisionase family DNA binding protein
MSPTQSPKWCSIQDAAEHFGVSVWTVRRYISAGRIHAERIGPKMIRVDVASLNQLGRSL